MFFSILSLSFSDAAVGTVPATLMMLQMPSPSVPIRPAYDSRMDLLPEDVGGTKQKIQAAEIPIMTLTNLRQATSQPQEAFVSWPRELWPFWKLESSRGEGESVRLGEGGGRTQENGTLTHNRGRDPWRPRKGSS